MGDSIHLKKCISHPKAKIGFGTIEIPKKIPCTNSEISRKMDGKTTWIQGLLRSKHQSARKPLRSLFEALKKGRKILFLFCNP